MDEPESEIEQVKETLQEYKETVVERGELLDRQQDALELQDSEGRMWVHPQDDGTTVEIHLFDDIEGSTWGFDLERSRIMTYLVHELGFRDPHTPLWGGERMSFRVDYNDLREYLGKTPIGDINSP